MILLASELNSFLFDMKTSLQAFACFSSAFRLNFLPHPSGHKTRSFSLSGGSDSSNYCSRIGFYSWAIIFCYYFFSIFCWAGSTFTSTFLTSSFFGGGASYFFTYYLGGYLAINILFWIGIFGGSLIGFFYSTKGSSLRTNFNDCLFSYGSEIFWSALMPLESCMTLLDISSE